MEQNLPKLDITQVVRVLAEVRLADDVVQYRNESSACVVGGNSGRTTSRQSELSIRLGGPLDGTRESRPHPVPNVVDWDMDG